MQAFDEDCLSLLRSTSLRAFAMEMTDRFMIFDIQNSFSGVN